MMPLPDFRKTIALILSMAIALAIASFFLIGPATLTPQETSGSGKEKFPRLIRKSDSSPQLSAEAVMVMRLWSSEVLYEREADKRLPIASLTKLMTALILTEADRPLDMIIFSQAAKTMGDGDDKRSSVKAGDRLKSEDVLKLLLVSSDNDAAWAAAEHVAARIPTGEADATFQERMTRFAEIMNERTRALGLANTHFANPTGRDDPDNFSTARDLVVFSAFIAEHRPELWVISRIQETFVFGEAGDRYGLVNTNILLHEYPAIFGSKTGFDDEARGALLLLYQLAPGELVAIAILRSPYRFTDGREAIQWLESNFVLESS